MPDPPPGPNPVFAADDRRGDTGTDTFAHAPGRVCKNCNQPIEARQPARRQGADDWVHDVCPVMSD